MSHWVRIKDPLGADQALFNDAKPVFTDLFDPSEQVPWQSFVIAILDTEERRKSRRKLDPEYFYYVCVKDNIVCGMGTFEICNSKSLGFIGYIGVQRKDIKACPNLVLAPQEITTMISEFNKEVV